MKVALFRKAHFNAAHRLHVPEWSDEKNIAVFGKCNNPNYHGHNYEVEVKIVGEVDPVTGMVMDLKELKDIVETHVCSYLDHKNLNLDIPEFEKLQPSTENMVMVIHQILRKQIDPKFDLHIRLYETPRNFAEYPA